MMTIPNRPIASTDIVDELDYPPPVALLDDDVVALADVGAPVGQLDMEGKSSIRELIITNLLEYMDDPSGWVSGQYGWYNNILSPGDGMWEATIRTPLILPDGVLERISYIEMVSTLFYNSPAESLGIVRLDLEYGVDVTQIGLADVWMNPGQGLSIQSEGVATRVYSNRVDEVTHWTVPDNIIIERLLVCGSGREGYSPGTRGIKSIKFILR